MGMTIIKNLMVRKGKSYNSPNKIIKPKLFKYYCPFIINILERKIKILKKVLFILVLRFKKLARIRIVYLKKTKSKLSYLINLLHKALKIHTFIQIVTKKNMQRKKESNIKNYPKSFKKKNLYFKKIFVIVIKI